MKKLFNLFLVSTMMVVVVSSCSKSDDDVFDSSVITTPSGYVSKLTFTTEKIVDSVKVNQESTLDFSYDSKDRVKTMLYNKTTSLDNGGSIVYSENASYTYEDDRVICFSLYEETKTEYIIDAENGTISTEVTYNWVTMSEVAELNSDATPSSVTMYSSDSYGSEYYLEIFTYNCINSNVVSYQRSKNDEIVGNGVVVWEDGNITRLGSDRFEYSSILNDSNIDLNIFLSYSEYMDKFGEFVSLIKDIQGIHSTNIISLCEEGYSNSVYDIINTTDSSGRLIQSKFDKGNTGCYVITDIEYY